MTGDRPVTGLDPQLPERERRLGTDPAFLDQYTAWLVAVEGCYQTSAASLYPDMYPRRIAPHVDG